MQTWIGEIGSGGKMVGRQLPRLLFRPRPSSFRLSPRLPASMRLNSRRPTFTVGPHRRIASRIFYFLLVWTPITVLPEPSRELGGVQAANRPGKTTGQCETME